MNYIMFINMCKIIRVIHCSHVTEQEVEGISDLDVRVLEGIATVEVSLPGYFH